MCAIHNMHLHKLNTANAIELRLQFSHLLKDGET